MQLELIIKADTAHELKQAILGLNDGYKVTVAEQRPAPGIKEELPKKEKSVATKIHEATVGIEEDVATGGDNITLETVRALMQKKSQGEAGNRQKVKELLNTYAAKLPDLAPDKYAEFMIKLNAL